MTISVHEAAVVTATFEAGVLIRYDVRSYLDGIQFKADGFTYLETKGFLSSKFHIKGPRYLLRTIMLLLEARYGDPV